ncbi:MAG: hypothetical protein AAFV43_09970 [Planctomycetota bacterium]
MIRLTLRSLLAYLDEVSDLDASQRAELRQQIEASDFAKELVHRLRDAEHRTRLPAPDVLGVGAADDPNTVAEYLENALPPESVAEFERVCLESDTMLAEVTACHGVLKDLLDSPAQVDLAELERVRDVVARTLEGGDVAIDERLRIENAHAASSANGALPTGGDDQEALREAAELIQQDERSQRILLGVGAVIAVVLGGLAFQLFAPQQVAKVTPDDQAAEVQADDTGAGDDAESTEGLAATPELVEDTSEDSVPEERTGAESDLPSMTETAGESLDIVAPSSPTPQEGTTASEQVAPSADETAMEAAPGGTEPAESPPGPATAAEAEATAEVAVSADAANEDATTDEDTTRDATGDTAPIEIVGEFDGPATAVAAIADDAGVWRRVPDDADLRTGARLASFPAFRSRVAVVGGVDVVLIDDTVIEFGVSREDAARPALIVEHGRLTITNAGAEDSRVIDVEADGLVSTVTINAGANLSVEVGRPYTPGFKTLDGSPPVAVSVWAPIGGVEWAVPDSATITAKKAKQWSLDSTGGLNSSYDYQGDPGWIEPTGRGVALERAAASLQVSLTTSEPILAQLVEASAGAALPEVKLLAARCAASLGSYDGVVGSLSDQRVKASDVVDNIAYLRRLISRDTTSADQVRRALVDFNGEETAIELFLMLNGYNAEQIGITAAQQQEGAIDQMLGSVGDPESPLAVLRLALVCLDELLADPVSNAIDPLRDTASDRRKAAQKLGRGLKRGTLELRTGASGSF